MQKLVRFLSLISDRGYNTVELKGLLLNETDSPHLL